MEAKGWMFDITADMKSAYAKACGTDTWYGFTGGWDTGTISATFSGSGTATLDYGNCLRSGEVKVHLNGEIISTASKSTPSKQIIFGYSPGDVLSLEEDYAIIKVNSLKLSCQGECMSPKYISTLFKYPSNLII